MKLAGPLVLLATILCSPSSLPAQERDGTIALPGQLRIDLPGEYLRADSRFGDAGDPWRTNGPLNRNRLTAVVGPADRFDAFLTATGGPAEAANGDSLSLGLLGLDGVVAVRHLPIRLGLGIVRGIEFGLSLPVVRTQRLVRRFDVAMGNLGLNPDAAGNTARLAGLGEAGEQMGGATLLPVAGSAAGELLQARALAATGETLELPSSPLDAGDIVSNFDFDRAPYDAGTWELGDLEADIRMQLLSSFSGQYPTEAQAGSNFRLILLGGYRFAAPFTVQAQQSVPAAAPTSSTIGYSGPHAGVIADVWVDRFWTTIGARGTWLSRDEDKVELPVDLELRPGSDLALDPYLGEGIEAWLAPRVRITREISLGAMVEGRFVGGAADVEGRDPGERKQLSAGLSLRFSSLPGMAAGERTQPIDATVGFTKPISGTSGEQRVSRTYLQVTLLPRLWGRGADVPAPPMPPLP